MEKFQENDNSRYLPLVRCRPGAGQLLFLHPSAHNVQVSAVFKCRRCFKSCHIFMCLFKLSEIPEKFDEDSNATCFFIRLSGRNVLFSITLSCICNM